MQNTPSDRAGDVGLLMRWGLLILALVVGGLFLASRALDDYTAIFGLLLAAFGGLLAVRLVVRTSP
ncbi:MAG: hypothetical protein JWO26_3256 [Rhodospirillales bacterium]|jgi:hypothetical protein|nr:hypothetical protein [Rhodospirillales bacterium]MDB5383624.1 hypothetical protein [Rhodospirillales bacterium]